MSIELCHDRAKMSNVDRLLEISDISRRFRGPVVVGVGSGVPRGNPHQLAWLAVELY